MRDGSFPFLRHLGPFGCVEPAVFSENSNLSKTRFSENLYSILFPDHLKQKSVLLGIFQQSYDTKPYWKIAKKPNH